MTKLLIYFKCGLNNWGLNREQLDSSTGRALHWHRRGQGSNPRSGLKFSCLSHCCLSSTKMTWSNSFINIFSHHCTNVFCPSCRCYLTSLTNPCLNERILVNQLFSSWVTKLLNCNIRGSLPQIFTCVKVLKINFIWLYKCMYKRDTCTTPRINARVIQMA